MTKKRKQVIENDIKTLLYISVGLIDSLFYAPLIYTILKNPQEALKSNNYYSWAWWSFSGLIIVVYMANVINDTPAMVITFLNFLACFSILAILSYYKIKQLKLTPKE